MVICPLAEATNYRQEANARRKRPIERLRRGSFVLGQRGSFCEEDSVVGVNAETTGPEGLKKLLGDTKHYLFNSEKVSLVQEQSNKKEIMYAEDCMIAVSPIEAFR